MEGRRLCGTELGVQGRIRLATTMESPPTSLCTPQSSYALKTGRAIAFRSIRALVALPLLLGTAGSVLPIDSHAADAAPYRVGSLGPNPAAVSAKYVQAFRDELQRRGFVEGRDLTIEYRYADGRSELLAPPDFLRRLRYVLYFHTPLQPPKRPEAADPSSGAAPPPIAT
jgi:hypothetical protein